MVTRGREGKEEDWGDSFNPIVKEERSQGTLRVPSEGAWLGPGSATAHCECYGVKPVSASLL